MNPPLPPQPPRRSRPPDLLTVLLEMYRSGHFPMADPETGDLGWYSADPRAIIPLEPGGFHLPRSLARRLRSRRFAITTDAAFEAVTRACAESRPGREDTWIDERILHAYGVLHRAGHAHSIEAWAPVPGGTGGERSLAGGIYGVSVGGAFFAESMFCRPEAGGTDASKVCLAHLVAHLRARGYRLLDLQMINPHTERFGAVEIPRPRFLARLALAAAQATRWLPFDPEANLASLLPAPPDSPSS